MIKKLILCLVLVVHPGFANEVEVSGWDEVRDKGVTSLVSSSVNRSDIHFAWTGEGIRYKGQCFVLIWYIQTKPYKIREYRDVTDRGGKTCWGVPNEPSTFDVILTIFNTPKYGVPLKPGQSGSVDNFTPDRCYVVQGYAVRDIGTDTPFAWTTNTQFGVCRMAPSASRCEINIPSQIQHRPAFVGVVNSTEAINGEISCNRPTNVRVSVPNNVVLSQGYSEITSAISLGDAGSSEIIVSPNPTTSFKISSTIAANTPTPGTYTGSFVLVAEWD